MGGNKDTLIEMTSITGRGTHQVFFLHPLENSANMLSGILLRRQEWHQQSFQQWGNSWHQPKLNSSNSNMWMLLRCVQYCQTKAMQQGYISASLVCVMETKSKIQRLQC